MNTAERLAEAFAIHRLGNLPAAEMVYRSVLTTEPDNVDALQLLGLVCRATQRVTEGAERLTAALKLRPDVAELHNNYGLCLLDQNQALSAELEFREALRLKSRYVDAWNNLGIVLRQQNRLPEAEEAFRSALAVEPHNPLTLCNLGPTLRALGRLQAAEACMRKALEIQPVNPEADNNLGLILADQQRLDEAEACMRRGIAARPTSVAIHNLARILWDCDRLEDAAILLQDGFKLDPTNRLILQNLGTLQMNLGNFEEAEALLRRNRDLDPDPTAAALANLASLLELRGQLREAEKCRHDALALDPDYSEALHDLGKQRLLEGRWEEGWPLLENRRRIGSAMAAPVPQPQWDGDSLAGRTILLWCEQGQGDDIQFVRYAREVKEMDARVVLLCPPSLAGLLVTCPGIDEVILWGEPIPSVDTHSPLMSLPGLFHTTPQTVPAEVPYLTADVDAQTLWKQRLGGLAGFKVGIVWRGNWKHSYDRRRSVSLSTFAPLAHRPKVQLISLQKDRGSEEMATIGASLGVHDLGEEYQNGTFADTAAILRNLDLVISVDTAVAHLAGALNVPIWLANRRDSDWRWGLEAGRTPWYPSMRIFRQQRLGDWQPVFESMGKFVRHRAEQQASRK